MSLFSFHAACRFPNSRVAFKFHVALPPLVQMNGYSLLIECCDHRHAGPLPSAYLDCHCQLGITSRHLRQALMRSGSLDFINSGCMNCVLLFVFSEKRAAPAREILRLVACVLHVQFVHVPVLVFGDSQLSTNNIHASGKKGKGREWGSGTCTALIVIQLYVGHS